MSTPRRLLLCLSLTALLGCVSTDSAPPSLTAYSKQIVPGKTTRADLIAALGEPTKTTPGSRGGTVLTWIQHVSETRDASGAMREPWADHRSGGAAFVIQRPTSLSVHVSDAGIVTTHQLLAP